MSGQNLWMYNRENFMWDATNKQTGVFQQQNLLISQHSLFREDIRDLNALTTSKLGNYFIVTTLKLGFIVAIFWNFDRTDTISERPEGYGHIETLFTLLFITSFCFLLTSLWFATNALIISNSYMTKLLVQTVRIPIAGREQTEELVPPAREYEAQHRSAFRIPFLEQLRPSTNARSELSSAQAAQGSQARPPLGPGLEIRARAVSTLPHIKLYRQLMNHWIYFDFYCKASMTLGTSTMLSALGYYMLCYNAIVRLIKQPETLVLSLDLLDDHADMLSGLSAFIFMCMLTLWSAEGDLELRCPLRFLLGVLMLAGPMLSACLIFGVCIREKHIVFMIIVGLHLGWILMLCCLALEEDLASLARHWPAARYIDILECAEIETKPSFGWTVMSAGQNKESEDDWTHVDSLLLSSYGGQPVPSTEDFCSQFHPNAGSTENDAKYSARQRFRSLTILVTVIWILTMGAFAAKAIKQHIRT